MGTEVKLVRTIAAAIVEIMLWIAGQIAIPQFVATYTIPILTIGANLLVGIWFYERFRKLWLFEHGKIPSPSPIIVSPYCLIDFDFVADENGNNVDDFHWYAICLYVRSALDSGHVLRNVTGRVQYFFGNDLSMPIRGVEGSRVDLRHGETAVFELGHVLMRQVGNTLAGMPSGKMERKVVPGAHLDQLRSAPNTMYTVEVNDLGGEAKRFGQSKSMGLPTRLNVVFSGDDIVSKNVIVEFDLFAQDPDPFVIIVPDDASN